MAEKPEELSENLQRLRDEITCPVCHDVYEDPKLLPCCHYYCKECIVQLAGKEQPFPCPECRKDTFLVQDSADGFPPAFFVDRMKSAVSVLEKCRDVSGSLGAVAAIPSCDQCSSPEACSVAFCRQCTHFMCEFCEQAHKRLKVYSDHTVVRMIEESLEPGADVAVSLRSLSFDGHGSIESAKMCQRHTEQLKMYCFTCEEVICRDCTLIDHKDHQYEFVKACVPQIKQDLQDSLVPLEEAQAKLRKAKVKVEKFKARSHDHKKALEDEIQQHCHGVMQMVEKYQKEMLDQVHSKADDNLKSLATQEKSLEMSMEELQGVMNLVRNAASSESREEVVSVHKQLQEKIKEETARINALDLTPVVEPFSDILETRKKGIEDSLRKSIKVIPLAVDPIKCTVEVPEVETSTFKSFLLSTHCWSYAACSEGIIKAELKSMVDESVIQLLVSESPTKGTFQLSCTPKVRGHHQLTVAVNERPIPGSPFPVFVKHPPNQLGEPIRIINNVGVPIDITINQEGHLLVSDTFPNGILHTLTKDGQRIVGSKRKISSIRSIAIDREGCFIVTYLPALHMHYTNVIAKFDKDWKLIKKQRFSRGFFGGKVKISPDNQYYVCDTYNNMFVLRPLSKS